MVDLVQRFEGVLLCGMIGDVLGAPVEGWPASMIRNVHKEIKTYIPGPHMGVPGVMRCGMYTDDTNNALALATSLVRMKGVVCSEDCAKAYVEFWKHKPIRGCPPSASRLFQAFDNGDVTVDEMGKVSFPDGSFANGGAMKIGPIGILFYRATDAVLRKKVQLAILPTHIHPEAIDGAFMIAKSVAMLLNTVKETFNAPEFLQSLINSCETQEMKKRLILLQKHYGRGTFSSIFIGLEEPSSGAQMESYGEMNFQIRATVAVSCAIWAFLGNWENPLSCLSDAIGLGGDTDTIATMVGYMVGALHGTEWIPSHLFEGLENNEYGRDYLLQLARDLGELSTLEDSL